VAGHGEIRGGLKLADGRRLYLRGSRESIRSWPAPNRSDHFLPTVLLDPDSKNSQFPDNSVFLEPVVQAGMLGGIVGALDGHYGAQAVFAIGVDLISE